MRCCIPRCMSRQYSTMLGVWDSHMICTRVTTSGAQLEMWDLNVMSHDLFPTVTVSFLGSKGHEESISWNDCLLLTVHALCVYSLWFAASNWVKSEATERKTSWNYLDVTAMSNMEPKVLDVPQSVRGRLVVRMVHGNFKGYVPPCQFLKAFLSINSRGVLSDE